MVSICPTVTADNPHTYRAQIERVALFATRLHIDLSDGVLAPHKLIDPDKVWWPGGVRADLHVMMERPFEHTGVYRALGPQLVIVHAEAKGDFLEFAETMHRHGIETGVALLPGTPVKVLEGALDLVDHVLVFSGNLGHFGGRADLGLIDKVRQLRDLKPSLEIGWDGGISDTNAEKLAEAGVDVLNVGGYIQRSSRPAEAYQQLLKLLA